MKKENLTSLDELIDKYFGVKGTGSRNKFEKGYERFKLRALRRQARQGKRFCRKH